MTITATPVLITNGSTRTIIQNPGISPIEVAFQSNSVDWIEILGGDILVMDKDFYVRAIGAYSDREIKVIKD